MDSVSNGKPFKYIPDTETEVMKTNRRQKKKQYKKEHGANPPPEMYCKRKREEKKQSLYEQIARAVTLLCEAFDRLAAAVRESVAFLTIRDIKHDFPGLIVEKRPIAPCIVTAQALKKHRAAGQRRKTNHTRCRRVRKWK